MNTLKTKIITEPKIKRKLNGAEKVCCVGVNRDSQLCYLSAAKQLNYLDVGNFITITSCSARSSKNDIYVDLTDQSKVCDFICWCYCEDWLLIMCDLSLHALVIAILMAYLLTHCARHCVMPQLHAVVNFTC